MYMQSFNTIKAKVEEFATQNYWYFVHRRTDHRQMDRQDDSSIPSKTCFAGV